MNQIYYRERLLSVNQLEWIYPADWLKIDSNIDEARKEYQRLHVNDKTNLLFNRIPRFLSAYARDF